MPNLPCELLDYIVHLLRDNQPSLRSSCLVSRSWIPRTRKHLFAEIDFQTTRRPRLQLWKKAFPDPSISPAHYTKDLAIGCPQLVAEASSLIASFSSVEELGLGGWGSQVAPKWGLAFVLLRSFSPVLKSLRVDIPCLPFPYFFDFVLSFPLLENLDINERPEDNAPIENGGDSNGLSTIVQNTQLSNLPTFTGSLCLFLTEGIKPVVHRLLTLQSGIHFRKLTLGWVCEEDISLTTALVENCSRTLEFLDVLYELRGTSIGSPRPHG